VQTESVHVCFYTAVKFYYQKTRRGQYNGDYVLEKKSLTCFILWEKVLIYSGKTLFWQTFTI
jgi:hypothetical protein